MRALLERSNSVRLVVTLLAAVCILGLVHAAVAGDDVGLRRGTDLPDALLAAFGFSTPAPVRAAADIEPVLITPSVPKRRVPRRIWAAAHGRPLRITLERPRKLARPTKTSTRVASRRPVIATPVALRLVPVPTRSAIVSIYNDRTLRSGDAVMLGDGLHVFRDDGGWPHRPRDFVRLQFMAGLDWHLRRTLEPFDKNPPTRWTSIMMPPA